MNVRIRSIPADAHVLRQDVVDVRQLVADDEKLAPIIAPALDKALCVRVEHNREEMIKALCSIMGRAVMREPIRNLARVATRACAPRPAQVSYSTPAS